MRTTILAGSWRGRVQLGVQLEVDGSGNVTCRFRPLQAAQDNSGGWINVNEDLDRKTDRRIDRSIALCVNNTHAHRVLQHAAVVVHNERIP